MSLLLINACVLALENYSGTLLLKSNVQSIVVENNQVRGVVLDNGTKINAKIIDG